MIKHDEDILTESIALAEYMYSKLADFPEEEKWHTANKLRTSSNDLMFYIAQAVGNTAPSGANFEWNSALKCIIALRTLYRFAARQEYLQLEPEIMVRLDALLKKIDTEVVKARKQTEAANKKDMDDWLKRYKIWSETRL